MTSGLFGRLQQELVTREKHPGLTMAEVLGLPDDVRRLINWMMRQRAATLADAARFMQCDEAAARGRLADLVEQGFVREFELRGTLYYQVRLAPKRGRAMPADLWQALDEKVEG